MLITSPYTTVLAARDEAQPLGKDAQGRWLWIFRGDVYSTHSALQPIEATALLLEAENTGKMKIARARALMEQASAISERRRGVISNDVKMAVWNRDGGRCVRCGSRERLEFDHIIPHAMGGADTFRNLQILCESCNRSKGKSII
jgi:5-methylcytosine-specific restriction endonuclease McrA